MEEIEQIITGLQTVVEGRSLESVTAALTAFLSEVVYQWHKSPEEVRSMYRLWADAAIIMAEIQDGFTSNSKFQTSQDAAQKEAIEAARQKTGNVPGTSSVN